MLEAINGLTFGVSNNRIFSAVGAIRDSSVAKKTWQKMKTYAFMQMERVRSRRESLDSIRLSTSRMPCGVRGGFLRIATRGRRIIMTELPSPYIRA